ncbi:hypothetical protein [Pseudomonas retamae]|uniref:Uncharacterized protein n=1 Tax=Pseudomonas retamae TaxID=702110 RepID=A0ABW7DHY0_9PSED
MECVNGLVSNIPDLSAIKLAQMCIARQTAVAAGQLPRLKREQPVSVSLLAMAVDPAMQALSELEQ